MSQPPIIPSPRPLQQSSSVIPLSSSSLSLLPLKPPQPPLLIDPSGFNALVKEHHQRQQQMITAPSLTPVRPLPFPSPSHPTDPSTTSSPSTAPSTLALSTTPISLHWHGPPRPDFSTPSPFQPVFPFNRQTGGQFTGPGLSFPSPSPPPQPQPTTGGGQTGSSSASPSSMAELSPAESPAFTPLQSGATALLFPQSPPSTAIQSFAASYGHQQQQPPSPMVSVPFDRSASALSSPFPSHAAHSTYFTTPDLSAYQQQQHAAYMQQMMKGMVTVQGGGGGVMGMEAVGVKRKDMHAGYIGPTTIPPTGSAAAAVAAAASAAAAAAAAAAAGAGGRHSACQVCHSAKTSCNGQRPCDRCIRLDRQSLCVDRPRKQPMRTDKKKGGGSSGSSSKDSSGQKKHKRDSAEGEGEAHSSGGRVKEEKETHSSEQQQNGSSSLLKAEAPQSSSSVPSTSHTASTSSVPSNLLQEPGSLPRAVSAHSNHSSSSSTDSSTSSSACSVAAAAEDVIDVTTATAASEVDRRLSSTYLRMHQTQATRTAIAHGISQGKATPSQVHFLLSYLAAVLHPDDFHQLLHPTLNPSSSSSSSSSSSEPTTLTLPGDVVNDQGVYVPRYAFNFAKSSLEPIDDSPTLGMDFATLQIIRGEPSAALNWDDDTADTNGAAATSTARPSVDTHKAEADSEKAGSDSAEGIGGRLSSSSSSGPPTPSAPFASSMSAFSAFSPTSSSSTSPSTSSSSSPTGHPSARTSSPLSPSTSLSPASSPSTSSSSASATTPPPEPMFLLIRVNREFERLFGYSQATMRDLFRSEGSKVLYRLLVPQSLPQLSKWLTEAMLGGRTEYRALVTIINKWDTHHTHLDSSTLR